MPTIKVNNINLFYKEYGQGEPIIFVSGFAADNTIWGNIVNQFAKFYRVIVFDNRGVGLSDHPNYPYTVDMMTDDVVDLCHNLNINSAHFIGNSMGGCIVQNLAYKFPQLTKTAVIGNSFSKVNSRLKLWVESRALLFKSNIPEEALFKDILPQVYSNEFLARHGMVENLIQLMKLAPPPVTEASFYCQMHALLNFDSSAWLKDITRPCLIISADDDLLADVAHARKLSELIPKAQYYCFKNVGHLPHIEQSDIYNKLVLDFLAQFK
ncbi:MAG: alpha/beta hydrolase [Gammaproteobacteria bacterium]|nr:alpha/beta hydrolase [Gammaproteobacteria bacterium]